MQNSGKSEYIIQNLAGCGPFQVVLVFLVSVVTKSAAAFTMMLMAFGNYNPGWRCLDSKVTTFFNSSNNESQEYIKDNCPLFDSCENVEFHPDTSTIVTEWKLLCDKAWVPSFIISIQMAGLVVGSLFAGQLGDAIGRKKVIYGAQISVLIVNIISIFSPSWEMFACLRFLLGIPIACVTCLFYVYVAEYVPSKWRAPLSALPSWSLSCIFFAVTCMVLKDWRQIHVATAVIAGIGFLPVIWVPESLRWLEAKNKIGKIEHAVKKVAKVNRKTLPLFEDINIETNQIARPISDKTYTYLDIFRPVYRIHTVCLALPWFSLSLIYYALTFGVKALGGNFYLNLILPYATGIPLCFLPVIASNSLGRKKASIIFMGLSGMCLLLAACFNRLTTGGLKTIGIIILATVGRVIIVFLWGVMMTFTVEMYPTVVRGLGQSFGLSLARAGGIVAPFLVPSDPGMFFVCYIIMGILAIVCCLVISRLPETRGKPLKDTFEDAEENNIEEDENENSSGLYVA